jgi:hypothetical protein
MKKVYLIDKYDKYCPENNNGEYIVGVGSSREEAEKMVKRLEKDSLWGGDGYHIMEMTLDKVWCDDIEEGEE